MAKIKLTKNELKVQKDALKMYQRYLPTLTLKKQQLQSEIRAIEAKEKAVRQRKETLEKECAKGALGRFCARLGRRKRKIGFVRFVLLEADSARRICVSSRKRSIDILFHVRPACVDEAEFE